MLASLSITEDNMATRAVKGVYSRQVAHVSDDYGAINLYLDTGDDGSNIRFTPEQANELADVLRAFALIVAVPHT